ncbi:hypothetical protein O3P69_019042 [Scylla paramamosain]|uniref:Uncharacterized protein n=1 Tax=Scylla paramamosain TaxID=85552 RepID=A0AAW0T757_SCYPA
MMRVQKEKGANKESKDLPDREGLRANKDLPDRGAKGRPRTCRIKRTTGAKGRARISRTERVSGAKGRARQGGGDNKKRIPADKNKRMMDVLSAVCNNATIYRPFVKLSLFSDIIGVKGMPVEKLSQLMTAPKRDNKGSVFDRVSSKALKKLVAIEPNGLAVSETMEEEGEDDSKKKGTREAAALRSR